MASIYIGRFVGTGSSYGVYDCYLDYNPYRSGNNLILGDATVNMYRQGTKYSTNRFAICAAFNGGDRNLLNNHTIKSYGSNSAASYSISLGSPSIATNGDFPIYIAIASTGSSASWGNFQTTPLEYSANLGGVAPWGPSAPSSANVPGSAAPDKTVNVNWSGSSGGTNGVSGYQIAWSKNGGSTWEYIDVGNTTNYNLNLNSLGFVQGSVLKIAVKSYTTVNGYNYYSNWTYSGSTTTLFVAPSVPKSINLNTGSNEPILTVPYNITWLAPDSGGTNGISGYTVAFYRNNVWLKDIDVGRVLNYSFNLSAISNEYQVEDTIKVGVYAYTSGQGTKYYSSLAYSGTVTIISDKFIFASINGASFNKYKMYISVNGNAFTEVKKEKLKVI